MFNIRWNKAIFTALMLIAGMSMLASVVIFTPVFARNDPTATPPQPTVYTQAINRTLTIGSVTVELEETRHSSESLEVEYSYRSSVPNQIVHPMLNGYTVTRTDGTVLDVSSSSFREDEGVGIEKFDLDVAIPETGENIDISLGSYIVPAESDVTGTARIDFAPNFETSYNAALNAPDAAHPIELPVQSDLEVGERQYSVTKITVLPTNFRLDVVPINEEARRVELFGVDLSAEPTLSDNNGGTYYLDGGSTTFDELSPRGHISQQFIFQGIIPPATTFLILNVRGGGEIVGPFVFGAVGLVSENIEQSGTPVTPGNIDGDEGPIGVANDPTPTAVPTATPTPAAQSNP